MTFTEPVRTGSADAGHATTEDEELAGLDAPRRPARAPHTLVDAIRSHAATRRDAAALIDGRRTWTYGELVDAIDARVVSLGTERQLVALTAAPTADFVIAYLACAAAGHAVLVLPADHAAGSEIDSVFVPDVTIRWRADGDELPADVDRAAVERRPASGSSGGDLHADLALLLSTSGSTGSPKLVRLSQRNVLSNAAAIASYLDLRAHDRAITSLPLHYCYGLSVLHSHLVAGACVVLTGTQVVDPCFWRLVREHDVSTISAVPHTFELLERVDLASMSVPSLRRITCAGGRLAPANVVRWCEVGARQGWELFVMYGQTEATARMAYLPPADAARYPQAIGRPIPGGSIELRPHPMADAGVGEIVYRGPNVMMGYAHARPDLARGPELDCLTTGDLARRVPGTDYLEIVGRAGRFVKPMSIRVDLDRLEQLLAARGMRAACTGDDTCVRVAVEGNAADACREAVLDLTRLPRGCVQVAACERLPRSASGKVDYPAVDRLARTGEVPEIDVRADEVRTDVAAMYRALLDADRVSLDDTFVSLGGDSLSYVEVSLALERALDPLPEGWHLLTVGELQQRVDATRTRGRRRWGASIDTTLLLRCTGILAVVATHMRIVRFPGGAHLLLAVVGYNFARFQLQRTGRWDVLRAGVRTATRVGVPTSLWIGANMILAGGYSLGALLLVNDYTGSSWRRGGRWEYWFFEAFVKVIVVASLLMSVPLLRQWERRAPWAFSIGVLAPLLLFRYDIVQFGDPYNALFRLHTIAWFFALGWMIERSRTTWQRVVTSATVVALVAGFFGRSQREWFIIVGLLALTWCRHLRVPRPAVRPIGAIAGASMWIFLVHWQVWPMFTGVFVREAAYVLTVAVGVLVAIAVQRGGALVRAPRVRRLLHRGGRDAGSGEALAHV